ncbi:MAG TPA: serine--tRNA ligase, partial [Allosphingosinicella sp.]
SRIDELRRQRNELSAGFKTADPADRPALGAQAKAMGAEATEAEATLAGVSEELNGLMLRLPNIPWDGAPVGPDENSNVVIRTEGTPPEFDFEPRDHVALLEMNDWAELGRITQVAGARQYCLKGRLALLEQALMFHAQQRLAADGFTLMTVPALARPQAFVATGHFPGHEEEAYEVPKDELYLAGTGEIALTSLHSGEILEEAQLPILYAGYSPCFRREAGSAGRDVRGLLRVHQFLKLEQYVICEDDPEVSAKWHARLLANAEMLLQDLEIPYQVVETSTGDMGLGKFRMNDIESWVPSLSKYRETHSCSTLHDWQARRANLRWRDGERKVRFVHTLNNTALASPRILVPLLENHQQADGRVKLPKALQPLMGSEYL